MFATLADDSEECKLRNSIWTSCNSHCWWINFQCSPFYDGLEAIDYKYMLLAYLIGEIRISCRRNFHDMGFILSGRHVLETLSKLQQSDRITRDYDIVRSRPSWFHLTFPNPGWMLGSKLCYRDNPCYGNTQPLLLQRRPVSFHLAGRRRPQFFFFFFGARTIVFIDYPIKEYNINRVYYHILMRQLENAI